MIVRFQSRATAQWFSTILVPAARSASSQGRLAPDPLDTDGPAIEIISVVSMAVALSVLEAGLACVQTIPVESDTTAALPATMGTDTALRAFDALKEKGLSVTRQRSIGWAAYVCRANGKVLSSPSSSSPASSSASGGLAFSSELPFKSLSLSFGEFRHASLMMEQLYLTPRKFMDVTAGRKHLNRPDMETLSVHYTSERSCDFRSTSHSVLQKVSSWKTDPQQRPAAVADVNAVQAQLKAFAVAFARSPCDPDLVGCAAIPLLENVGEDAFGEALGVVAFFAFLSRVVDTTGHTHPMLSVVSQCSKCWRGLVVIIIFLLLILAVSAHTVQRLDFGALGFWDEEVEL